MDAVTSHEHALRMPAIPEDAAARWLILTRALAAQRLRATLQHGTWARRDVRLLRQAAKVLSLCAGAAGHSVHAGRGVRWLSLALRLYASMPATSMGRVRLYAAALPALLGKGRRVQALARGVQASAAHDASAIASAALSKRLLVRLATTRTGLGILQEVIKHLDEPTCRLASLELAEELCKLSLHRWGNYAVQCFMECCPARHWEQHVMRCLVDEYEHLVHDEFACRVYQTALCCSSSGRALDELLSMILKDTTSLASSRYGNYVARCALRRFPAQHGAFTKAFCALRHWPPYGYLFALELVEAGAAPELYAMLMALSQRALDYFLNGKPQIFDFLTGLLQRLPARSAELLAERALELDVEPGPAMHILLSSARTSRCMVTPTESRDDPLWRSVMSAGL